MPPCCKFPFGTALMLIMQPDTQGTFLFRCVGPVSRELTAFCNEFAERLETLAPSFVEFALPWVDMPIGNVLQKHDFSGRQLAGLELFPLYRQPVVQGTFGAVAGTARKPCVLSVECC